MLYGVVLLTQMCYNIPMKLYYDKKSKDPTYFIQQGYRIGKKTTTKNIVRIGKHSELLAITDDPLAYAKEQVAKYNEEMKNNSKVTMDLTIDFNEKIINPNETVSASTLLNIGYFYLQQIYHDLRIGDFFKTVLMTRKTEFDPDMVNRFLVCSRIMSPGSKLDMHKHLSRFYEKPDFNYVHILRTMDLLAENYDKYIKHLYENSENIVKRNTSVCYYDCTNYYFETESPDDDYVDEVTGEIIKGFRKYGPSKEHRPNPLVEMGLFMDGDGIPISMCLAPGSDNEQTTVVPLEKKLVEMFKGKKFIYCADAGLGSLNARKFNSMGGRAFVVTQSLKKLSDTLKATVFNDYDYRLLSDDSEISVEYLKRFDKAECSNAKLYTDRAYKIIEADNILDLGFYENVRLKSGKLAKRKAKGVLKQKLIVYFSRKMMEYQRWIRSRQIERAKNLLANLDPESFKKGPNDVTRFIRRIKGTQAPEKNIYCLDEEKIKEEERYDGYYVIATNLDDDAKTILSINSGRYKIEDCFRLMKTNFESRPVYHHNKERIISHFMICYTALLVYRLLEKKLNMVGKHFTSSDVIETLQNLNVACVNDIIYMATYKGSDILTALNGIYPEIPLDRKYYQPKDLNKMIKKISS